MIPKISKASEQIAGGTDDAHLRASFLEKEVYVNSYLNVLRTASAIALCLEFWMQPEWRSGLSLPEWTKEHAVSSKEGHSSTFCCSLARLQLGTSPGSHFNVLSLTPTLCFLLIVSYLWQTPFVAAHTVVSKPLTYTSTASFLRDFLGWGGGHRSLCSAHRLSVLCALPYSSWASFGQGAGAWNIQRLTQTDRDRDL